SPIFKPLMLSVLLLSLAILAGPAVGQTFGNFTWVFEKLDYHPTTVTFGNVLRFRVNGTMDATSSSELRIEIYTASDNTSALFSICSPTIISIGSGLSGSINATVLNSQWIMESKGNDYRSERAILNVVNITNTGASGANSKIVFEFSAIVLNSPRMALNTSYYVSFGARYANQTKVWVGQAAYPWQNVTANTSATVSNLTLTGPSSLMIGETGVFTAKFTTGVMLNQIIMDIFAPLNTTDIMSVCFATIGEDSGRSFSCGPTSGNLTFPSRVLYDAASGEYRNAIATFDAGELINGAMRTGSTTDADNTVTFKIAAKMLNGSSVGTPYKFGIALQHNYAQIWTASVNVSAEAANWTTPSANPVMQLTQNMDYVMIGSTATVFLNMTLPRNSTTNYKVEVALPFNDSQALMTFQRIRILHVGRNMPCFYYNTNNVTLISSANDTNKDYIIFDLGPITDTGIRSGLYDDDIVIEISGLVLNHSLITSGGSLKVVAGVRYGNAIWVSSQNFTVVTTQPTYPINKQLQITLKNAMTVSTIYNGTTHAFWLDIYQPIGTHYGPMDIELITVMDNNRAVLSICDVQVLLLGDNFININTSSLTVTNVSTADDGFVDRVLIRFPSKYVSNVGMLDFPWSREKNTIRFQILTSITPHYITNTSNLFNDSLYWIGASVKYEENKLFVSRVGVDYDPTTTFNNISSVNESSFSTVQQTPNTTVWVGGTYTMQYNMTSVIQSYGRYVIDVVSLNENLHICRVGLAKRGVNVPCLGQMIEPNVTLANGSSTIVKEYQLDLLNFANVGQPCTKYSGSDNSGLFDVVLQVKSGTSGSVVSAGGVIYIGSKKLWVDGVNITINSTLPSIQFTPQFSLGLRNGSQNLVRNGTHTVVLEGYLPVDTLGEYSVDFLVPFNTSDRGKLHICSTRVVRVGWNLPCVNDTQLTRVFNDTYDSGATDRSQINLGFIQNIATSGAVVQEDNKIIIEADIYVNGTMTSVGETLWVGASVNISNSLVWVGSKSLTVTDTLPTITGLNPYITPAVTDTVQMNIFEERTFTFNVTIAESLTNFTLTIYSNATPASSEAKFTFRELNVTYKGTNICCQDKLNFVYSNVSTLGNTQVDVIMANAYVGNTGVFRRHQWSKYHKDSDVLQFKVKARLMDHEDNIANSVQYIYCNLTFSGETVSTNAPVMVNITATDKPSLQIFQTEVQNLSVYSKIPGADVQLAIRLNHTETSRGNAYGVNLFWYIPYVIGYSAFVSSVPFTVTVQNNTNASEGILITFPRITYTDDLYIVINATVDPLGALKYGSGITFITLLADAFYTHRNKPGSVVTTTAVNAYSPTFRAGLNVFVPDCANPLGMESGAIADCQITSSGYLGTDSPLHSRYNSTAAWTTLHRGPPFYGNEFLEINLGNRTRVSAVRLQSHKDDTNNKVDTFWFQYSEEGLLWFDVNSNNTNTKEVYTATYSGGSAYVKLNKAIVGRYIRILPLTGSPKTYSRSLRVEFYGCQQTTDVTPAEACYEVTTKATGFSHSRSYVISPKEGAIYACMLYRPGGRAHCSRSVDFGASWEALDSVISQIGFVLPTDSSIYGTAYDERSRMKSIDGGWSWFAISEEDYTTNLALGRRAIEIPWQDFGTNNATLLCPTYGMKYNDTFTVSVDVTGLHISKDGQNKTWTLIAGWADANWL
ncbi:hypothetical protein BOX15_Mlig025174g3, partial [Macrostomum lignano]